jgi:hypothetical protein
MELNMSPQSPILSVEERRDEIVRIFAKGIRRIVQPPESRDSDYEKELSKSPLTPLEVIPESRLHSCDDNPFERKELRA